jgi:hypothetical protein
MVYRDSDARTSARLRNRLFRFFSLNRVVTFGGVQKLFLLICVVLFPRFSWIEFPGRPARRASKPRYTALFRFGGVKQSMMAD